MRSLLLLMLALAFPLSAQAFDLTGTWEGKYTCKGSDGSNFTYSVPTILEITHVGTEIRAQFPFDMGADVYAGFSIDDDRKPLDKGVAYFIHCGMTDAPGSGENGYDETAFVRATTKSNGGGTLKGSTVFFVSDPPPEVSSCKWSYKRTSTTDPAVPSCL
jgi:hypothetical protein